MYNEIIASSHISIHSVIVVFYMWGQRCETAFSNEKDALRWLSTCSDKGWLMAEEIIGYDGKILYEGDDLRHLVDQ
jgi:hypothetical protein